MVTNVVGRLLRIRVSPRSVIIRLTVDKEIEIACRPLPATDGAVITLLQQIAIDGSDRKIVVGFDDERVIAVSNDVTVPDCLGHAFDPVSFEWMRGTGVRERLNYRTSKTPDPVEFIEAAKHR